LREKEEGMAKTAGSPPLIVGSLLLALALAGPPAAGADAASGLLDALSRVPDTPAVREQLVSYVDYRAVEAGRPGAARPASFAELEPLLATDDPAAGLWMAAYMGIASGSTDLVRNLFHAGGEWPELLGFDFLQVDRELAFGAPPDDGVVLLGHFDPEAIGRALSARSFSGTDVGERTLWCGPEGCQAGMAMNLAERDPADPFGGELGRRQPLAVSASDLLSSAAIATVDAMLAAADGQARSLADDASYRAAAEAIPTEALLIQATLVPGDDLGADVAPMLLGDSIEDVEATLAEMAASFEPIPPYELLAISDGATDSEQVVTLGLVYAREADAAVAIKVIPRRLETMESLRTGQPLSALLDDRGVTSVAGEVVPAAADGARAVAAITLRAPLAGEEPDPDSGGFSPSSLLYRLFVQMLLGRDTLWLAPELPELG
jgi:hypothetical protein